MHIAATTKTHFLESSTIWQLIHYFQAVFSLNTLSFTTVDKRVFLPSMQKQAINNMSNKLSLKYCGIEMWLWKAFYKMCFTCLCCKRKISSHAVLFTHSCSYTRNGSHNFAMQSGIVSNTLDCTEKTRGILLWMSRWNWENEQVFESKVKAKFSHNNWNATPLKYDVTMLCSLKFNVYLCAIATTAATIPGLTGFPPEMWIVNCSA